MDAEQQNNTTDSNVVEDTSDAQCEDAESVESTEGEAKISGIGDTDEDDGASGDGDTGNDDAGDENAGSIIDMESVELMPEKMISSDKTGKKRFVDDDAEFDEYGPLPTLPLKRARSAYFIFADEKRKGVAQEVSLSSLKMQRLIDHWRMINRGVLVLSFHMIGSKNDSTRERASPSSRRRSANSGPPSTSLRRKLTRPRRRRKRSVSLVIGSVLLTPVVRPTVAPPTPPRRGRTS
jgi:hypothetical protein